MKHKHGNLPSNFGFNFNLRSFIEACNGVVHTIGNVLLAFDGDSELDAEQKVRLAEIQGRFDKMTNERGRRGEGEGRREEGEE